MRLPNRFSSLKRTNSHGFTLVELMIVVVIIAVIAAIAIPRFANLILKSKESATKGGLGELRAALSIYFGDNDQIYPTDTLGSLTSNLKYLSLIPQVKIPKNHLDTFNVSPEPYPTDTGTWSYNNNDASTTWGDLFVGCLHQDAYGSTWTAY